MSNELSPAADPLAAPFFLAAADGRLVVQRCKSCGALRWPPLRGCPDCRGRATSWVDVEPRGTVWSFVVYHRAFAASLKDQVPYTVVMVQLDDGPFMVGRLVAGEPRPSVGDRVEADFSNVDRVPTVRWRLAAPRRAG